MVPIGAGLRRSTSWVGRLFLVFLTWHIPSVAAAMTVGTVHLSLADVHYPDAGRGCGGAAGLATAGRLFHPRLERAQLL